MSHSIPLVNNGTHFNRVISSFEQSIQAAIVLLLSNSVEPLIFNVFDAGAKRLPQHGKCSKVNFCICTLVKKPFIRVKIALIVEVRIQYFGSIFVCWFFCEVVKECVIISNKNI